MSADLDPTNTKDKASAGVWVGRVISTLVSLLFVMSGLFKLVAGGPEAAKEMARLGFTESMALPLAILELTCVLLYLIPHTAMIGAILLTGYMGGAICTHWRVGDPFVFQVGIAVLVWLGLYLRERRLHALIPLRR